MSGNTNLNEVLKSLQVSCDNVKYGFANIKDQKVALSNEVIGIFQETEGKTVIATDKFLTQNNIPYDGPLAKLTIEVHTSLNLIGLTAVLAKKLADNLISANVVAGYFHDHIFVQFDLRQKAIDAINKLRIN